MIVTFPAPDFFPLRYRHAVWLPFLGFAMAAFHLESRAAPALSLLMEDPGLLSTLCYLLPLAAPEARSQDGYLRRMLLGYGLLFSARALSLLAPGLGAAGLAPNLCAGGVFIAFLGAWRPGPRPFLLVASGALLATCLALLASQRQAWTELAIGLVAGWAAYRLAFSHDLDFFDHPNLWSYGFSEFRALFIENRKDYWEDNYSSGKWAFLRSDNERPRHYAISGIVHDRFPGGAEILDIGCGYGTLYPLLKPRASSYAGVDLSEAVIRECRRIFPENGGCRFEACSFEDYRPDRKFDVVILNEVIYYFHYDAVEKAFRTALSLLKDDRSVLIVSTGSNPKAAWTRRKLSRLASPVQSQRVTNERSGSSWTVNTYQGG